MIANDENKDCPKSGCVDCDNSPVRIVPSLDGTVFFRLKYKCKTHGGQGFCQLIVREKPKLTLIQGGIKS